MLTAGAGLWSAYLLKNLLTYSEYAKPQTYYLPVVGLIVFAVLFSLTSILIRSKSLSYGSLLIAFAGGGLFILSHNQVYLLLVLAATAVAFFAVSQIHKELRESVSFRVRKVLKEGLPVFFTALAILFAAFSYVINTYENFGSIVPRPLYNAILPYLKEPLAKVLPGFNPEATVDEFILEQSKNEAAKSGLKFESLPDREVNEILINQRQVLSQRLGLKLTGREKLGDLLFEVINQKANEVTSRYQQYLPLAATFGVFATVKTFTLPLYWLTLLITAFVLKFLTTAGVLTEETETIDVKRLRL